MVHYNACARLPQREREREREREKCVFKISCIYLTSLKSVVVADTVAGTRRRYCTVFITAGMHAMAISLRLVRLAAHIKVLESS